MRPFIVTLPFTNPRSFALIMQLVDEIPNDWFNRSGQDVGSIADITNANTAIT